MNLNSNQMQMSPLAHWTCAWAKAQNLSFFYQAKVDSTNNWAKKTGGFEELKECKETQDLSPSRHANRLNGVSSSWKMYLTDHQWAGRGRGQRRWYNGVPGTCFLVSFAHQNVKSPSYLLPIRLGLALYRTLTLCWPSLPWRLKAPNDIYLGEGKVAGLLLELLQKDKVYFLVLGLGMNVFSSPSTFKENRREEGKANLPPVSHLQTFLKKPLEESSWQCFLEELYRQWQKESADRTSKRFSVLSLEEQKELLLALNACQKENRYEKVDARGNLYLFDGSQVSWQSL